MTSFNYNFYTLNNVRKRKGNNMKVKTVTRFYQLEKIKIKQMYCLEVFIMLYFDWWLVKQGLKLLFIKRTMF